jgi:hypothetical protein
MMHMNKLLVTLAFSILFSNGVSAAEEDVGAFEAPPITCYALAWNALGLTTGQAIKLCSGTADAPKTITCFIKAYGTAEEDGLGLTKGFAVNLCKTNSEPFFE